MIDLEPGMLRSIPYLYSNGRSIDTLNSAKCGHRIKSENTHKSLYRPESSIYRFNNFVNADFCGI